MVRTLQTHSSVIPRDSIVTMSLKQNSVNGRRGVANSSPQWPGRPTLLQKAVGSPVSVGSPQVLKKNPLSLATRTRETTKDIDTPVKESLSSNITPRSSARKARVDSASSTPIGTPTGTPNNSRPTSMIYKQGRDEGLNIIPSLGTKGTNMGRTVRSTSISSDCSSSIRHHILDSNERSLLDSRTISPEAKPMFFRADDVRPGLASIPSERFYEPDHTTGLVRGGTVGDNGTGRSSASTSPSIGGRPKFFHANGAVEATTLSPKPATGRATRPRSQILTIADTPVSPQSQRAPSPLKDEVLSRNSSLNKASPRRHTRLVSNSKTVLDQEIRSPEASSFGLSNISRRSSLNTPNHPRYSHARSPSADTADSAQAQRLKTMLTDNSISKSPTVGPIGQPEFSQDVQASPISALDNLQPQGPEKSAQGKSKLDHMNELAANARRERKVLDLEISNSSLLAINRTLEREMRKQNAELRRFRRLSRTGRISVAPSSRSASKTLSVVSECDIQTNGSDDFSDQSSLSLSGEDEEENENGSAVSSSSSSNPISHFRDSRIRAKNSKRLHLDLARHRALLVDSQKLNQSIKRCLGWTEDLIADGKKALEYRVHVGNEQTRGGRVLLPDELGEAEVGQRQGLLSPGISDRANMSWEIPDVDGEGIEHPKGEENLDDTYPATNEEAAADGQHSISFDESPNPDPNVRNEWDRIKDDVQTPDELIGTGTSVHVLKEYLSSLGPSWGL